MHRPAAVTFTFTLLLALAFALARPASAASYRDTLAAAEALAAESSWEQARARYTEAFASAPDATARLWCELWIEDATWRSEATTRIRWREGPPWSERHLAVYDRLAQPYRDGHTRDDFWSAVLTSRAKFEQFLGLPIAWKHYAAIADHLAAQPPSPAAAGRYVEFLQRVLDSASANPPQEFLSLRVHLSHGAQIGATADDRAWCVWQLARIGESEGVPAENPLSRASEPATRWSAALAATAGTRWAPFARAEEFLWRVSSGWSPGLPADTPADIPALLDELRAARRGLAGETTAAAKAAQTQLDLLERSLVEPRLEADTSFLFPPGSPIRFSYGTCGLVRLAATLVRVAPADWLALPDVFPHHAQKPIPRPSPLETVREWTIPLSDPARLSWSAQIAEAAPRLTVGLYVLTLRGEKPDGGSPLAWRHRFLVSSLRGLGAFSSAATGKLFLYHAGDGRPLAGASVHATSVTRSASRAWSDTTDELGSLAIPALDAQANGVLALAGDEPVWFNGVATWRGDPHSLLVDVYADRPLFRPGETAHWKLIARERHGGRFTVPSDLTGVNLRIMLGDTALVEPRPLQLTANGTAQGEIKIPADARAGEATLQLFHDPSPKPAVDTSSPLFRVDRFVPPAVVAQLAFTGDARSFRPGRELAARVTAGYFSGGPLPSTPVRFTFTPDEPVYGSLAEETNNWTAQLAREPQQAVTDARGEAEATLTLPAFLPDGFKLKLTADLTPEGAPAVSAHASVTLSASGLTLDPLGWTAPRLAAPGDTAAFAAVVRDGRGSPAAFAGRAQLLEIRWSEVWLDAQGRALPAEEVAAFFRQHGPQRPPVDGAKLVYADYTETVVAESPVQTADDGRIEAKFKLPHAGAFRLRVIGDREITAATTWSFPQGQIFSAQRAGRQPEPANAPPREPLSVIAADEHTDSLALNPETAALVAAGELSTGQPLRVLALAPAGVERAWLSVTGENSLIAGRAALQGRLALPTFADLPSLLGEARVDFAYEAAEASPNRPISTTVPTAKAPLELHVTVTPAATESRPGQPAQVLLSAKDSAGQPAASAELAVRVADEAVNALLSNDPAEAPPDFLSLRRTASQRLVLSTGDAHELRLTIDPRNGAIRNPTSPFSEDGELITLSPFAVGGSSRGYYASATLAGGRVRTEFKDMASAISVVASDKFEPGAAAPLPIELRHHFASTAFWSPDVITDEKGEAHVTFTYPDNLTRWRLGAYAVGADGNTFGTANAFTRTSLPFQARLQLPRFLIAGDTAEPSATLVNRTAADLRATATLALAGTATAREPAALAHAGLLVSPDSESHTAWAIHADAPGEAQLKLSARAGAESDAMSLPLPILPDGIQQSTAAFGRLAADAAETHFSLELPATLDPSRTTVSVQLSPNYATTLLDALPYLIDYPYGCVEQTMSRFLPAVVVRQTLLDLGLDATAIEQRILATESPADQKRRAATAGLAHLDDVVRQSLSRLEEAQTYLGFGWWPGAGSPDLWMTAYVSWGLSLAAAAKVEIPDDLTTRTTQSLVNLVTAADSFDDRLAFAWAALARVPDSDQPLRPDTAAPLFAKAFAARDRLSASGRACLVLAAKTFGTRAQLDTLVRNLDNGLQRADAAGLGATVHWGAGHDYWRASDGAVESTALTLLALLAVDRDSPLIEPAACWLVLNRRSAHWSSTRDTTFALLALNAYLQARGHLDAAGEVELLANRTSVSRFKFSRATLLTTPSTISIPPSALRAGANTFTLRRLSGANLVLAAALGSSWARGDEVKPAGHLVTVARFFERQKAEPTLIGTLRLTSLPLGASGTAQAGEEVTARVTVTVPNELEYVMIEVPKPAGCEPLNPLSGWDARLVPVDPAPSSSTDRLRSAASEPAATAIRQPPPDEGRPLYREEHDDRSAFFLDHVAAGTWELRFRLRTVTPGDFRALPVTAEAMYAPEITANSDARRLLIEHAP